MPQQRKQAPSKHADESWGAYMRRLKKGIEEHTGQDDPDRVRMSHYWMLEKWLDNEVTADLEPALLRRETPDGGAGPVRRLRECWVQTYNRQQQIRSDSNADLRLKNGVEVDFDVVDIPAEVFSSEPDMCLHYSLNLCGADLTLDDVLKAPSFHRLLEKLAEFKMDLNLSYYWGADTEENARICSEDFIEPIQTEYGYLYLFVMTCEEFDLEKWGPCMAASTASGLYLAGDHPERPKPPFCPHLQRVETGMYAVVDNSRNRRPR